MKNALIISGNLVQDHEFIYPYYRLLEDNFNVDVCLLGGKEVVGILGTRIPPNKDQIIIDIGTVKFDDYNLLVIPGGAKAMEYLRQDKKILDIIKKFNDNKIIIASICHGAQLLISAKVVEGRNMTGYYSIEDDINNAKAYFQNLPVVVDGNLITSPHYKFLGDWMKEVLKKFN